MVYQCEDLKSLATETETRAKDTRKLFPRLEFHFIAVEKNMGYNRLSLEEILIWVTGKMTT